MVDVDHQMEDLSTGVYAPIKLQSPMQEHKQLRRSQSLTMYMDLDDPSDFEEGSPGPATRLKSGCLILCCCPMSECCAHRVQRRNHTWPAQTVEDFSEP